jgi:2-oxoglutarate dehydrogenase complex dehydrogenase (E1) component-like enzyme
MHPEPRNYIGGMENLIKDYRKYGVHYSDLDPLNLSWRPGSFPEIK